MANWLRHHIWQLGLGVLVLAGFGWVESVLMVVAVINLHHFIVDGYIWRLKADKDNRRVIESGLSAPA